MLNNKNLKMYVGYAILFCIVFVSLFLFIKNTKLRELLSSVENRTFDARQSFLVSSGARKPSKDIVLLTIDDASYEYLLDKYGEWPIPRDVYAKVINYLETKDPSVIAFDLMFVKSMKSKTNADQALANAIKNNKNVYTSMNFDNESSELREPIDLDKKFTINVKNQSKIDFANNLTFTNCRSILPQILSGTKNVGMINVFRENDGILRKMPPFLIYKNNFYPHLALMVGLKYLEKNQGIKVDDFIVDKNGHLNIGKYSIPIDKDGGVILNWYGPAQGTYQEVPLYKVIKAINGEGKLDFDFKNKIVYIGTTAVSLYDTKSVPVDKIYPGVEVHATYINNLIDNSFIKRIDYKVDVLISVALALLIAFLILRIGSAFVALATTTLLTTGYIVFAYYLMKFFNIWISIMLPIISIISAFIIGYIVKYLLKSRDFEHQYRLATTDGLTELYNHRYFQEQMLQQIENSKRYNLNFSLILIDIDFFKKFNDTFGHQSGDAVLKQVAQRLKKNVRATDYVCRYGGEEMSIILPNTDKEEAIITAQKLCQIIAEQPCKLVNNQESTVTISLGVATYPEDGMAPNLLIERADQGLYNAKENGRNQVGK